MEIILFKKTEGCPHCVTAIQILDEAGVEYKTVDAFEDPDRAREYGVRKVPTLFVDGVKYINVSEFKQSITK